MASAAQRLVKPGIALAMLTPWLWLGYLIYLETQQVGSGLGPDPVEELLHHLGEWSLIVLLCAFSVTPLQRRFGWAVLIRSRRMIGLFAFAFVLAHAGVYAVFYVELNWQLLLDEVVKRPYITLGMASLLILTALAVTSTRGWQRRLGRRWKWLHRWIYLAVPLALAHLLWLRKDGYADLVVYSIWAAVMAGERFYSWRLRVQEKTSPS